MKLVVLSVLLLLQLTSEITGYAIQSKRSFFNRRSESLFDDGDKGLNDLFSDFGSTLGGFGNQLDDNEKVIEALDLLAAVGQQWFNAYKERKLEPITSTLYKMITTIIVKTNNEIEIE